MGEEQDDLRARLEAAFHDVDPYRWHGQYIGDAERVCREFIAANYVSTDHANRVLAEERAHFADVAAQLAALVAERDGLRDRLAALEAACRALCGAETWEGGFLIDTDPDAYNAAMDRIGTELDAIATFHRGFSVPEEER